MRQSVYALFLLLFPLTGVTAYGSPATYWGFCGPDKLAYADVSLKVRKEVADWVCQCPTALETGDERDGNSLRCKSGQRRECEVGAAGDPSLHGDHNVPRGAWYWIPGVNGSGKYPDVRCQCGCFSADVRILTIEGYLPVGKMAKDATRIGGYSVATLSDSEQFKASTRLVNKDFTVGPEEKKVYTIKTANGTVITLTDSHPVLVEEDSEQKMIRADALEIGSQLVLEAGDTTSVTAIKTGKLPKNNNMVYNFDTKGKSHSEHIIFANGLRVGDLFWQKRLSEKSSRMENILKFSRGNP